MKSCKFWGKNLGSHRIEFRRAFVLKQVVLSVANVQSLPTAGKFEINVKIFTQKHVNARGASSM